MTRQEIIDKAADVVAHSRQDTYGAPEKNFETIAAFWNTYLAAKADPVIGPHDVAVMMILLKMARVAKSPGHADNWVDAVGYAVCGGEIGTSSEAS